MGVLYHTKGRYYTLRGKYKNEYGKWVNYERLSKEYQFKKKADAVEEEKKLRKELTKKNQSTLHQNITFSEAADVYFNIMRNQRKASTIETDIKTLKLLGGINDL